MKLQFRLRTLLIVVTLLAVPLGYVGWQAKVVRARKAWLLANSQVIALTVGKLHEATDKTQQPGLIRRWLGDEEEETIVVFDPKPGDIEAAAGLFPEADLLEFNHGSAPFVGYPVEPIGKEFP